jgi:small-conductance mechanosensitive channel
VTDSDWLTTTLFDVDLGADTYSYTGRTSVIPNSMLLTSTVQNLNFMRRYVAHTFSITRHSAKVNLFEMRDPILTRIHEYSAHFRDVAIRYNNLIEKRLDIKMPSPEPSVRITTTHDGHDVFTVTLFCPTQEAAQIEQKITEDFMVLWFELATRSSVS